VDSYADAVAWLEALQSRRGWDLKLERMRAACAIVGSPQRSFGVLHVAGTNGKGSTAAFAESVLRASGVRTGLYTSPHLVDFAERIRAGGGCIPPEVVVALVDELRAALDGAGLELTYFELATLLAFVWFARIGVELAVIEVGLGGRLDATNVVEPLACAVTSIALDHEAWLGSTLEAIAAEKAGILKAGVPAVTGRLEPAAARVVADRAAAVGARLLRAGIDFTLEGPDDALVFRGPAGLVWDGLRLGLRGAVQRRNAEVALGMLACIRDAWPASPEAVRCGLAAAAWPGRLAIVSEAPLLLLDGAHNLAGVEALTRELPTIVGKRPVTVVLAVMADKPASEIARRLAPLASRVVLTRVGPRSADPGGLAAAIPPGPAIVVQPDPHVAIQHALTSTPPGEAILVTGSLFLVGAAYAVVGGRHARLFEPWHGWGGVGRGPQP